MGFLLKEDGEATKAALKVEGYLSKAIRRGVFFQHPLLGQVREVVAEMCHQQLEERANSRGHCTQQSRSQISTATAGP